MNSYFKYGKYLLVGLFLTAFNQSCTDLDEELFGDLTPDNFLQTDEEIATALGAAYTNLYGYGGNANIFSLQEVTSDEVVVPTRGNDWDDGGNWRRLHLHTYNSEDDRIRDGWTFGFGGVNACNRLLFQFSEAGITEYDAELRVLRSLFYLFLLDTYGNVPVIDRFDLPDDFVSTNATRKEVYDFIETTILDNIDGLSKEVDATTYGRINFYAAQAILASLYLNAEVYTGEAQWQKCIDACDAIIDSGNFSLAANYYDNFVTENSGSPEFIFAIAYDEVFARGFNLAQMTLHYGSQRTYKLAEQPWNGFCSLQEFYDSYEDDDIRKNNFLVGPQFDSDGSTPIVDDASSDPDGPEIIFTPEINELGPNAYRQAGARIGKFEFAQGSTRHLNNDFPIYRYTEILLNKAEALWRLNNGDGDALALVNSIRDRAGVDDFGALDADNLLAERGREMFAEAKRRTDLIRFGRYNDAWWAKDADPSDHVNIFPVPKEQLDANPALEQNPGY